MNLSNLTNYRFNYEFNNLSYNSSIENMIIVYVENRHFIREKNNGSDGARGEKEWTSLCKRQIGSQKASRLHFTRDCRPAGYIRPSKKGDIA